MLSSVMFYWEWMVHTLAACSTIAFHQTLSHEYSCVHNATFEALSRSLSASVRRSYVASHLLDNRQQLRVLAGWRPVNRQSSQGWRSNHWSGRRGNPGCRRRRCTVGLGCFGCKRSRCFWVAWCHRGSRSRATGLNYHIIVLDDRHSVTHDQRQPQAASVCQTHTQIINYDLRSSFHKPTFSVSHIHTAMFGRFLNWKQ